MQHKPIKSGILAVCVISWVLFLAGGLHLLVRHSTTPGPAATPPPHWPADSGVPRMAGRSTLLMLAHPRCPCTRASIGELAKLMTTHRDRVTAFVLFLQPNDRAIDWTKTDLWRSAMAIPGVQVLADVEGREAARFHAHTSGETMLYNATGQLLFHGGITSERGHAGDNDGRTSLAMLLRLGQADRSRTPVFGCELASADLMSGTP